MASDWSDRILRETALLDNSSFWTKQRRELVQWLDDRAPSFTEGYVAAVRLLYSPSFPARVHLVCHVVRDIYRHLPGALGEKSLSRPFEVFPDMVKELAKRWEKYPPNSARTPADARDDFAVSPQVYRYVECIVRKSLKIAKQSTVGGHLVTALFRSLDRREEEFIHPWIIESFDAEYDFFVARAHPAKSVDKIPNEDGLNEHFESFERAFHSLVCSYFTGKEELDAILQDTNTAAD